MNLWLAFTLLRVIGCLLEGAGTGRQFQCIENPVHFHGNYTALPSYCLSVYTELRQSVCLPCQLISSKINGHLQAEIIHFVRGRSTWKEGRLPCLLICLLVTCQRVFWRAVQLQTKSSRLEAVQHLCKRCQAVSHPISHILLDTCYSYFFQNERSRPGVTEESNCSKEGSGGSPQETSSASNVSGDDPGGPLELKGTQWLIKTEDPQVPCRQLQGLRR